MEVIMLAAVSVDGFIARSLTEPSFDWTSAEDKQFYVQTIKSVDAIVMGRTSFQTFSRYPRNSRWVIYTSKPTDFINPKPELIKAEGTNEEPAALIERLKSEGCQKIAICGGASIYSQFMKAGVVDRLYLTVEPLLFGTGVKLFSDALTTKLKLEQILHLSDATKVMEYSISR